MCIVIVSVLTLFYKACNLGGYPAIYAMELLGMDGLKLAINCLTNLGCPLASRSMKNYIQSLKRFVVIKLTFKEHSLREMGFQK